MVKGLLSTLGTARLRDSIFEGRGAEAGKQGEKGPLSQ
jgi:hypothetical protein